jgi:hypothetical protein
MGTRTAIQKGAMPLTESGVYGVPQDVVLPVSKINFLNSEMGCSNQPQAYLCALYGDYDRPNYTYLATASATTWQRWIIKATCPCVDTVDQFQGMRPSFCETGVEPGRGAS